MIEPLDIEDILHDALEIFGGEQVTDQRTVEYGPLKLSIAPKEGKANTLLADHLYSPALLLAEQIERGEIVLSGKKVVELGAGCALPSLLSAALPGERSPSLVVVTDYPDKIILRNLEDNLSRNKCNFNPGCHVRCIGYEWGQDIAPIIHLSANSGYDIVILSDLLHYDSSHAVLVTAIASLLAKSADAQIHVAAGKYTAPNICDNFLALASDAGFEWVECTEATGANDSHMNAWKGTLKVSGLDVDELGVRKGMCRWWIGRWKYIHLV